MKNNMIISLFIIAILIACAFAGYWFFQQESRLLLSSSEIVGFTVEEYKKNNRQYIALFGEYSGSGLSIGQVKTEKSGSDLYVYVWTALQSGKDGSFAELINIDSDVKAVYLGSDKKKIWEKD